MRLILGPRVSTVVCGIAAAISVAGSAAAAGLIVAPGGGQPSIAVDSSGTGHIAFVATSAVSGASKQFVSYCRLPRGASSCAQRVDFPLPGNATATFGTPQAMVDGSRVVVVGEALGGSASGLYAWVSNNGGLSFTTSSAATKISDDLAPAHALLGPGAGNVSAIDSVRTGGVDWVTGSLAGGNGIAPFKIGQDVSSGGTDAEFQAALGLLDASTPFAVMSTTNAVYLRVFARSGAGFNTAANWFPATRIDGGSASGTPVPVATSGPAGAFVAYATNVYAAGGYPLELRRIRADGTPAAAQNPLPGGTNPIDVAIAEDAAGRVHIAYVDNNDGNQLEYVWSKDGATFSGAVKVGDAGEAARGTALGVGPDGGGWIVGDPAGGVKAWPLTTKGTADPVPAPVAADPSLATPPDAPPSPPPATSVVVSAPHAIACPAGRQRYATPKASACGFAPGPDFKVAAATQLGHLRRLVITPTAKLERVTVSCVSTCKRKTKPATSATKKGATTVSVGALGALPGSVIEVQLAAALTTPRYTTYAVLKKRPYLKRVASGCVPQSAMHAPC